MFYRSLTGARCSRRRSPHAHCSGRLRDFGSRPGKAVLENVFEGKQGYFGDISPFLNVAPTLPVFGDFLLARDEQGRILFDAGRTVGHPLLLVYSICQARQGGEVVDYPSRRFTERNGSRLNQNFGPCRETSAVLCCYGLNGFGNLLERHSRTLLPNVIVIIFGSVWPFPCKINK